jgi:hypothetical protein
MLMGYYLKPQDVDLYKLNLFFFANSESENFIIFPDFSPNWSWIDVIRIGAYHYD